ncbi:hypothetical protein [Nitrobacter sp. JJSN]
MTVGLREVARKRKDIRAMTAGRRSSQER